jgi:hypothetical protein
MLPVERSYGKQFAVILLKSVDAGEDGACTNDAAVGQCLTVLHEDVDSTQASQDGQTSPGRVFPAHRADDSASVVLHRGDPALS